MKDIEIPRLQVKPTQGRRQKSEAGSFVPCSRRILTSSHRSLPLINSSQLLSALLAPSHLCSTFFPAHLLSTAPHLFSSSQLFSPLLNSSQLFSPLPTSSHRFSLFSSLHKSSLLCSPLFSSSHLFSTLLISSRISQLSSHFTFPQCEIEIN